MWIPKMVIQEMREIMDKRKQKGGAKRKKDDIDSVTKMTVTIPYIRAVSEALSWGVQLSRP